MTRKHADDSMLMKACVEFISPREMVDYEDRPISRLFCKIRVEPRINTRADPGEGLLAVSCTEALSLPSLAIIHHQMQGANVGAVVQWAQMMQIGASIHATIIVVITWGRIDGHWQLVEDPSKGVEFFGFTTCCEIATGDYEIEVTGIEDSRQIIAQILRQASPLGGQVHVRDLGEVEMTPRIEGGTDTAKGWHRRTLITGT